MNSREAEIDRWIQSHTTDLALWRRHIHANPELARREFGTTAFVIEQLEAAGLSPKPLPGGTGLICDIGPDGPRVALRADMDALPLQEKTGAAYSSTVPGVSHACGHDAHTTVLLATGLALASLPDLQYGVRLIFQPAEEVMPGGALDAVAAGALDGVTKIFALHCDPRLEVGQVGVRVGAITSAADTVELRLDSPGGHTSRPHLTTDLVYALGTVITGLPGMLSRRIDPRTSTVMVWGAVVAGQAPNAIPQTGMLTGTVRTGDHETWALLEPLVREIVTGLLAPTGVQFELHYRRGVPPVVNDPASTHTFEKAIERVGPTALADTAQSGGGEDFSWYLERVPGAMARLGVWPGTGPQLDIHQPTFDLDERALAVGVKVMTGIALDPN
ncbi:M20 family metallopeptidase [Rhodococcoides yunnanense]|uniref:M20 family metallopeptidase n=1 Tax=Rhodococcoides yunnanense TaxID=278209 RepID=A0ABU4BGC8_9NOCA|nr:M20 family metallopeptidase [Rhodococcus yunnanensis]MDV6263278.1 M20 family metallopeptidase [Rhodococcus yunnanensis]